MNLHLGIGAAAGLGTGLAWSLCSLAFAAAGRRIGSIAVNHVRLLIAAALLPLMHLGVQHALLPEGVSGRDLGLLVLSGFVGLTLGDASGFSALARIGAARSTLVVTLTPAIAALLAWLFLGEKLPPLAIVAMVVTVAGLLLAVIGRFAHDRQSAVAQPEGRALAIGLLLALGGAVGQASGQVLSRPALANVAPLSATLIRVWSGAALTFLITIAICTARRKLPGWWGAWRDREALKFTIAGTITGPTCGVWLSQVATRHAPVGVAATLMALVPAWVMIEEAAARVRRPDWREISGVVVALAGVALLLHALQS